MRRLTVLCSGLLLSSVIFSTSLLAATLPSGMPSGERWIQHLNEDLLPFWSVPDALGTPVGNFPTFRCNDGRAINPEAPCPEITNAPGWIKPEIGRQYLRMHARQTYAYGVAYHLTGDARYLQWAKAGVDYLRNTGINPATGATPVYLENGQPSTIPASAQDLAYAELGMGFYYYLTRDPVVLNDIIKLKQHIFGTYLRPELNQLAWVTTPPKSSEIKRQELVAQLDQINGYMLLLTPVLPEPYQSEWKADLRWLSQVMRTQYYDAASGTFRGTLGQTDSNEPGARHNDYGHTIKTFWMLERVGVLLKDSELTQFARTGATAILKKAYVKDSGSWSNRWLGPKSRDLNKDWWIYCELDQTTATLALSNPAYAELLPNTYNFWLQNFVDHENHEVWGKVGDNIQPKTDGLKIHQWKSGYHAFEHTLVAYLTTQALANAKATLYFALPPDSKAPLKPYFFTGKVVDQIQTETGQQVHFTLKTTYPVKNSRPFAAILK